MNWRDRIVSDPNICHGQTCIRGTRVLVSVVLDNLAAGESHRDIQAGYDLTEEDIQAVLQYAAELSKERMSPLPDVA